MLEGMFFLNIPSESGNEMFGMFYRPCSDISGGASGMFGMFFRIINAHHSRKRDVENKHPAQHPVRKSITPQGVRDVRDVREVFPTFAIRRSRKIIHIAGSTFYFPNIPTSRVGPNEKRRMALKVNQRKLLIVKCPGCNHEFPNPMTVLHLPADIKLLVECLTLPSTTVTAMLDRREIPIRSTVDKNGLPHGSEGGSAG